LIRPCGIASGALLIAFCFTGCGGETGPPRYEVSGKVTFGGQPVPNGSITFAPDGAAGNKGPLTATVVKDGVYKTESGKGAIAGDTIITILPPAASSETPPDQVKGQFQPFEARVKLPKEKSVHDFDIPSGSSE
jgi:hypothetical protein